jgi:hypothetical protein
VVVRFCFETAQLVDSRTDLSTDLFGSRQGVEDLGNDFSGSRAARLIDRLDLEELRIGEYYAELIVQSMKEQTELGAELGAFDPEVRAARRQVHACDPVVGLAPAVTCRDDAAGSRQRESAKMRIAPPAVRTYSTLPAEIQL